MLYRLEYELENYRKNWFYNNSVIILKFSFSCSFNNKLKEYITNNYDNFNKFCIQQFTFYFSPFTLHRSKLSIYNNKYLVVIYEGIEHIFYKYLDSIFKFLVQNIYRDSDFTINKYKQNYLVRYNNDDILLFDNTLGKPYVQLCLLRNLERYMPDIYNELIINDNNNYSLKSDDPDIFDNIRKTIDLDNYYSSLKSYKNN